MRFKYICNTLLFFVCLFVRWLNLQHCYFIFKNTHSTQLKFLKVFTSMPSIKNFYIMYIFITSMVYFIKLEVKPKCVDYNSKMEYALMMTFGPQSYFIQLLHFIQKVEYLTYIIRCNAVFKVTIIKNTSSTILITVAVNSLLHIVYFYF